MEKATPLPFLERLWMALEDGSFSWGWMQKVFTECAQGVVTLDLPTIYSQLIILKFRRECLRRWSIKRDNLVHQSASHRYSKKLLGRTKPSFNSLPPGKLGNI